MSVQFGPEWREFDRRLLRTPQVTEEALRRTLQASLLLIEADARTNVQQDTRRLAGSINSRIDGAYPTLTGRVGPNVRYGAVVEFGRRAGARMPPVDALIGWVRRHWGPATPRVLRGRAFVLARSIQRRGIPPRPFMAPAYQKNQTRITQAFARIGVQITTYLAGA